MSFFLTIHSCPAVRAVVHIISVAFHIVSNSVKRGLATSGAFPGIVEVVLDSVPARRAVLRDRQPLNDNRGFFGSPCHFFASFGLYRHRRWDGGSVRCLRCVFACIFLGVPPRLPVMAIYSGKWYFVTAIGNSSISLAQIAVPFPLHRSQQSGKPPIPSNKLPRVAGRSYCAAIRRRSQNQ